MVYICTYKVQLFYTPFLFFDQYAYIAYIQFLDFEINIRLKGYYPSFTPLYTYLGNGRGFPRGGLFHPAIHSVCFS